MHDYITYQNSDENGKKRIFQQMVYEHNWMLETIKTMAVELDALKPQKGVPESLQLLARKSKMPKIIS